MELNIYYLYMNVEVYIFEMLEKYVLKSVYIEITSFWSIMHPLWNVLLNYSFSYNNYTWINN